MNGSASHAVTRPGSHLSRTGQAPGLTFLQVSLETGLLLLATPLAGLSSPGAKAVGRAEDGPPVFRSPGLSLGPFFRVLQSGRASSLGGRQLSLNVVTANLSQAICAPAAWRKRDLSRPRMSTCAQERRDRAKRMGAPARLGPLGGGPATRAVSCVPEGGFLSPLSRSPVGQLLADPAACFWPPQGEGLGRTWSPP